MTISESAVAQFSFTVSKSKRALGVLRNPRVTFGRCFSDDFGVGRDSAFVAYFSIKRGCEC
jgi:hypothetical protein